MEGAGGVLDGANEEVVEEVPVGERRLVQGLSPAPAADEVDEGVDPAEALDEGGAPGARGVLVEEVDGATVPAVLGDGQLRGERVEGALVPVGPGHDRPGLSEARGHHRPQPPTDPGDGDNAAVEGTHMGEAGFEPA